MKVPKTKINSNTKYNISTIAPPTFEHNGTWSEIAETLFFGLKKLGYSVNKSENYIARDAINIILSGSFLDASAQYVLPKNTIIYNFEQLSDDTVWLTNSYKKLLTNFQVWDYSIKNISFLDEFDTKYEPIYTPLGFIDEMERIKKNDKEDIDILFYGSHCDRRDKIIKELRSNGLVTEHLYGVYGDERDNFISRSKVILNMHYFPTNIFEMARVYYLLINKKAVVSEISPNTEVPSYLSNAICFAEYDQLVNKCKEIVENPKIKNIYEQRGYTTFKKNQETEFLKKSISLTNRNITKINSSFNTNNIGIA